MTDRAGNHADIDEWRRHPADAARLALAVLVTAAFALLAAMAPGAVRSVSADVVSAVQTIPPPIRAFLLGLAQLAALVGPVASLLTLGLRRHLRLLTVASAAAVGAALVVASIQGWLDRRIPPALLDQEASSWFTGVAFPSGAYLAGLTAAVVVLGSGATSRSRRIGVLLVAIAGLIRVATAVAVPLNLAITIGIGAAVGSLLLVILGAPMRRIGTDAVGAALAEIGLGVGSVGEIDVGAAHSRTFATTEPAMFVKLVGRDERAAELFGRTVRRLRVRGLEDERAEWSAAALARNEALAGLLAETHGVAVASVRGVGATAEGDGITALEALDGDLLADMAPEGVDDALLRACWQQLALTHRGGLAHRWFDASHILVQPDGGLRIIDWQWADIGASERSLALDIADLAVSLAAIAGVDRTLSAARQEISQQQLADALTVLQPLVLSRTNRQTLKAAPELMGELQPAMAEAAGVDEIEPADLARLSVQRVVGWIGAIVLIYVGLAFASNAGQISDSLSEADWSYTLPLLVLSVLTSVSGAISLMGTVSYRLPFLRTAEIMYAQSFLNRFTPANAGGMALRVRYLQANGSSLSQGAASIAITSAAGGIVQVVVLVVVGIWAGNSDSIDFDLPDASTIAGVMALIFVLAGAVALTPWGRKQVRTNIVPSLSHAWDELRTISRSPSLAGQLFGGALLGKVATLAAFVLSARALGIDDPAAVLCLLYMTANTVASASPTPGGVGAIEAALVTVLTGIGVPSGQALSTVMVFRIFTYWLPTLPAYVAFTRVRRTGLI